MSLSPLVSIIVPVYNSERYLDVCVNSVLSQSYVHWELYLIDDGSKDSSPQMCDNYSSYNNIHVFHKANGGVSSARNMGLDYASGDFILFLDSDDHLDVMTLEKAVSEIMMSEADILQFSLSRGGSLLEKTGPLSFEEYFSTKPYLVCAGGSLIRRSVVELHHLRFDESIRLAEDQLFMIQCMNVSSKIMSIPDILYYYCDNEASATNTPKSSFMLDSSFSLMNELWNLPVVRHHLCKMVFMFSWSSLMDADCDLRRCAEVLNLSRRCSFDPGPVMSAKALYLLMKLSPRLAVSILHLYLRRP